MAIPVPYKPVATQKAKGAVTEKGIRNSSKRGRVGKASPVQWVSSVQARSMSTTTTISYSYASDTNDGQLASRQALQEDVLSKFPQDNLVYSFGYGSGVFSQTLMDAKRKHEGMLDLILVVDDTETFHTANLKAHPHHYASWLQWGGPSLISKVQREFPLGDADVLFHVVDDPVTMKYGVVDQQDLFRDLKNWESLYLAGRLQKPTLPLVDPSPDEFVDAQQQNLEAAVASALLLLSPSDDRSWSAFFRTIASLSYTGDFRMQVGGEDPQKLDKLVQAPGQLRRFQDLYQPILEPFEKEGVISCSFVETGDDSQFNTLGLEWDTNDTATHFFLRDKLPESFQNKLSPTVSDPVQFSDILASVLAATVTPAARHQSFKGIFTLGPMRSFHYARAKLSKGWLRK
jgi:translocator assembly and maintenance protein 41